MDPYKILGIDIDSSLEEIKKAFRKKARDNHPDKGGDELRMKEINCAYEELIGITKYSLPLESFYKGDSDRPILKCKTCGKDTYYSLCLECWIKVRKEEKHKRIHNIRSFMLCLNCNKSLYDRNFNTLFCDVKCSKLYYKTRDKTKIKKHCTHNGQCLSTEDASRLKKTEVEKIISLEYKERIAIFTRLIGKKKAVWFDAKLQENIASGT